MDALPPATAAGTTAAQYLAMDAACAMDLDDVAGLDALTTELLAAYGAGPMAPQAAAMPGGPAALWPGAPNALHGALAGVEGLLACDGAEEGPCGYCWRVCWYVRGGVVEGACGRCVLACLGASMQCSVNAGHL